MVIFATDAISTPDLELILADATAPCCGESAAVCGQAPLVADAATSTPDRWATLE